MKIGIDIRCLTEGRKTGVEEYTVNILSNLFKLDTKNHYYLFINSFRSHKADLNWIKEFPNVSLKSLKIPNKALNLLFWYFNWPHIDKLLGGVDLLFMPNIMFNGASKKCKLVTTVHDLSFERFPEYFSWKRRFWHWLVNPRKLCQKSDALVTVSESSRNDIRDLYRINPEKINVVYNGVSENFRKIDRNDPKLVAVKEKYKLPYRFILYFGTLEPRKNVFSLIKAFERFKKEISDLKENGPFDHKLVIAGFSGWLSQDVYEYVNHSPFKESISLISCVEEKDREYLFNLASVFAYPSFFEGFGLPVLEAMKCELPVIASNNSSLPEVACDSAILIDPTRPNEIYLSLRELIFNPELKEKLSSRSRKTSQTFSWKRSARSLLDIFERISQIEK